MGRYNIRDLLGHWVRPRSKRDKMCPHACCKGRRVHPANFPVILPTQVLRRASDDELAHHYVKHVNNDRARGQIERELNRREGAQARRVIARDRAQHRRSIAAYERESEIEGAYIAAENATRGHMLNRKGKARGISERSLFTGSEERARRYASEDLLKWWERHPRPARTTRRSRDASQITRYRGLY